MGALAPGKPGSRLCLDSLNSPIKPHGRMWDSREARMACQRAPSSWGVWSPHPGMCASAWRGATHSLHRTRWKQQADSPASHRRPTLGAVHASCCTQRRGIHTLPPVASEDRGLTSDQPLAPHIYPMAGTASIPFIALAHSPGITNKLVGDG